MTTARPLTGEDLARHILTRLDSSNDRLKVLTEYLDSRPSGGWLDERRRCIEYLESQPDAHYKAAADLLRDLPSPPVK